MKMNTPGACRGSLAALIGLQLVASTAAIGCTHEWPTTSGQGGSTTTGPGSVDPPYVVGAGGGGGSDTLPGQGDPDSGGPSGGGRCPSQNSIARLYDGFDAPTLNSQWTLVPANDLSVNVPDGLLMFSLVDTDNNQHGGIISTASYDLTDCEISIGLVEPFLIDSSGYAYLSVKTDSDDVFEISVTDGRISMRQKIAGGDVEYLDSVVYSPAAHRFLRIRDEEDVITWETSPDGRQGTWNKHAAQVRRTSVSSVRVQIGGGTRPTGDAYPSDYASFDDVNILPQ